MAPDRILAVTSDSADAIAEPARAGAARRFDLVKDYAFAAPDGAPYLTLFELGGVAAGPDATDVTDVAAGPGTAATVFTQIAPASGWLAADGPRSGPVPAGEAVLYVIMDVDDAAIDLFNGWYDEEHLPAMVRVPGVDAARRFRATAGAGAPAGRQRFLALYECAGTDIFQGPEWDAVSTVTPRTAEVMPHVSWASQLYRRR